MTLIGTAFFILIGYFCVAMWVYNVQVRRVRGSETRLPRAGALRGVGCVCVRGCVCVCVWQGGGGKRESGEAGDTLVHRPHVAPRSLDIRQEDWTLLDGLYFTVATFTTVGYGDFGPVTTGGRYIKSH